MDDQLRGFLRNIIQHAIHSGINALFFRMPAVLILLVVSALIGVAVYFKLY